MEIKVRSKFVKGFQDCLEEAKRILCELLEQSPTFIVRLIWMLTYDPMLENYHKPDYQKWLERITSLVSSEKLDIFKNEVMYHLSRLQKDFFNLNIRFINQKIKIILLFNWRFCLYRFLMFCFNCSFRFNLFNLFFED